jgi:hypothetical protein
MLLSLYAPPSYSPSRNYEFPHRPSQEIRVASLVDRIDIFDFYSIATDHSTRKRTLGDASGSITENRTSARALIVEKQILEVVPVGIPIYVRKSDL